MTRFMNILASVALATALTPIAANTTTLSPLAYVHIAARTAIDTLTNQVITMMPIGQATQALTYVPSGLSNASPARTPAFSLNTPLDHIAANQRGKAVLERDLPRFMASRSYPLFDDMSLFQIAMMSGGRLSQTKLNLVQADLAQLSSSAGDGP